MPGWRKWLLPGLILVVLLTGLSARYLAPSLEDGLRAEISSELEAKFPWVEAELQIRDLTLKGTAPSRAELEELNKAVEAIEALDGVENLVGLLPAVTPYRFSFSRVGEKILLTGYVPTARVRQQILAMVRDRLPGIFISDQLGFARGEPDDFYESVQFSFDQLVNMTEGIAALRDNMLDLSGRAENPNAYAAIIQNLESERPEMLDLGRLDLQPAIVKPYLFSLKKRAETLSVSGFVPDTAIAADIKSKLASDLAQSDLRIAAGAPNHLLDAIEFARGLAEELSAGEVDLSDTTISITGAAKSSSAYETLLAMIETPPQGFAVLMHEISPPVIAPFTWTVSLDSDEIVLDGFAPSLDVRKALGERIASELPQANIGNRLQIASGEPENYDAFLQHMVELLPNLATATFRFEDGSLGFEGRASSVDAYVAALEKLDKMPPELGMVRRSLQPPKITPYRLSITRNDETLRLAGFVPSETVRTALLETIRELARSQKIIDETRIAAGARDGFFDVAKEAISLLPELSEARIGLVGDELTISGRAKTPEAFDKLLEAREAGRGGAQAQFDVMPPLVRQYELSLSKSAGELVVSGLVPDSSTRNMVVEAISKAVSQTPLINQMRIAEAEMASTNLVDAANFVARQLEQLESGKFTIVGNNLTVSGMAKTGAAFEALEKILKSELPEELVLASQQISFPARSPYRWSVSKQQNEIALSGFVPTRENANIVAAMAQAFPGNGKIEDLQKLASGEPADFDVLQRLAMAQVGLMEKGSATITDHRLEISGLAPNEETKTAIEAALQDQAPTGFEIDATISFVKPVAVPSRRPVDAPTAEELVSGLEEGAAGSNGAPPSETSEEPVNSEELASRATGEEESELAEQRVDLGTPVLACQRAIVGAIDGRQIFFERNGDAIRPESNAVLLSIAQAAPECGELNIEVAGYADGGGSEPDNKQLSQARAENVKRFLIKEGVPASRLQALGLGNGEGLETLSQSADNLRRNRIEFIVVE